MSYSRFWTSIAALALATSVTACGKKDKKSDDDSQPAPFTVTLNRKMTGEGTVISYKTTVKDATFMCMVEANGRGGSWEECPEGGLVLPTEAGVQYVVKVKAIAPDGTESIVAEDEIDSSTGGLNLTTQILNKAEIGQTYTKDKLTLNFGVSGAMVDVENLRFMCKRENETQFRRCPDGDTYDFGQLIDGSTYSLAVRAEHDQTESIGSEDMVSFKVALTQIEIDNVAQLDQQRGNVRLAFSQSVALGQAVWCGVDGASLENCSAGKDIDLDFLQPGSHQLRVEARDQMGVAVAVRTVNFCAQSCGGQGGPGGHGQPIIQDFMIGTSYKFNIPQYMHMTEYATSTGYNGSLSFYRVATTGPNADPYYIGNYACNGIFDVKLTAPSPSGIPYDYCYSTPTFDLYKWLTDNRIANNHIEVGTDQDKVGQFTHERIIINNFTANNPEPMMERSRFEQLCAVKRGTIQKSPPIPFVESFWGSIGGAARPMIAEFYMCTRALPGAGGALPTGTDDWWIGSFFISTQGLDLPRIECFNNDYRTHIQNPGNYGYDPQWCKNYANPELLEVVFIMKPLVVTPDGRQKILLNSYDFAQYAQQVFLQNLKPVMPLNQGFSNW